MSDEFVVSVAYSSEFALSIPDDVDDPETEAYQQARELAIEEIRDKPFEFITIDSHEVTTHD